MNLPTEAYEAQAERWPRSGRHILAHYDEASIVVYQAYRPSIAAFAVAEGRLGGPEFSFARMSWIKPNYLWMMFRSRWGTKEGQESTLGLRISREFFERILEQAVPSSYDSRLFADHESWKSAGDQSDVRLQWDPDHSPSGANLERRAIQLGLRGKTLRAVRDERAAGGHRSDGVRCGPARERRRCFRTPSHTRGAGLQAAQRHSTVARANR